MSIFATRSRTPLGIYIHVPFCRSKCQYCDFYSLTERTDKLVDGYLEAVCKHIREAGALAPDYVVDTVYFGGGTPSFLGAEGLSLILSAVRKAFRVAGDAEITFEANPDSVSDRLLKRLHGEGFNRVSLGIQCDKDDILKKLGRPHNYLQAVGAVERIRKHRFKNLSVDLMYGLPGQTLEGWKQTLENVLSLRPEHISCYGLKVEEGTPLCQFQEHYNLPDDDTQADMYLEGIDILRKYGYRQYEISNFCRKGLVSKHNLKYWQGGEYLGFGPNASSDFGGRRFTAIRDLQGYIDGIINGGQVMQEVEEISNRERAREYLMLSLRTSYGINRATYESRYRLSFTPVEKALMQFKERRLAAKMHDGRWRLTPEGFLLSNTIINELLTVQENSASLRRIRER